MHDNNGKPFIATLCNVILALDLCGQLFSIITLMNSGHTCLFHKGFCTEFFSDTEQNKVTLPHRAQIKHAFLVKKQRETQNNKIKLLKRNFILNDCIRDKDIYPQGYYWLYKMQTFGDILSSRWIMKHFAYHVRSLQ